MYIRRDESRSASCRLDKGAGNRCAFMFVKESGTRLGEGKSYKNQAIAKGAEP
jgi:hypothetical protein